MHSKHNIAFVYFSTQHPRLIYINKAPNKVFVLFINKESQPFIVFKANFELKHNP